MADHRMRVLQPPHASDHFTLDEAIAAWRKVAADKRAREARRRRSGSSPTTWRGPDGTTDEEHS